MSGDGRASPPLSFSPSVRVSGGRRILVRFVSVPYLDHLNRRRIRNGKRGKKSIRLDTHSRDDIEFLVKKAALHVIMIRRRRINEDDDAAPIAIAVALSKGLPRRTQIYLVL